MKHNHTQRILALVLGTVLVFGTIPVYAAEIGDNVHPTYDEAYYATTDYYGNLTQGSVVKSYALNGSDTIIDHGRYDEIINLTDNTAPICGGGTNSFSIKEPEESRFYFEGKTAQPFETLPWTLSMSYTLNGVPVEAEELAGQNGLVEITIHAVPNEAASDYAKNNMTLEMATAFNADDICSLEAPGAQIQLLGNLRSVLFMVLPGEEQHFTIRVGSDDFSFAGMTFLMVPATLSQLSDIADLREDKEEVEDSYHDISDSLDNILDSLNGMSGNLYATATGLDKLNEARGTISDGKGKIYEDIDKTVEDMGTMSDALEPTSKHVQAAKDTLVDVQEHMKLLNTTMLQTKDDLEDVEDFLGDIKHDDRKDLDKLQTKLKNLNGSLRELQENSETLQRAIMNEEVQDINEKGKPLFENGKPVYIKITELEEKLDSKQKALEKAEEALKPIKSTYEGLPKTLTNTVDYNKFIEFCVWNKMLALPVTSLLNGTYETAKADVETANPDGAKKLNDNVTNLQLVNTSGETLMARIEDGISKLNALKAIRSDTGLSALTASLIEASNPVSDSTQALLSQLVDFIDDTLDPRIADACVIGDALVDEAQELIEKMDALHTTLDEYEPDLEAALDDLVVVTDSLSNLSTDSTTLITDGEDLAKTSGVQLDEGTKQSLSGLSATLRKSASSLTSTDDIRDAKRSITDLIDDKWDEYTGEKNNILLMDANAKPMSLTSEANAAPESIQIVIRSQEIKVDENEDNEVVEENEADSTFLGRVGQMFKDFWHAITGLFN